MSIWLAIWNGPFHIGKLDRPVSVGDVLMKLLETLWRALVVVVCAALLGIALILWNAWREDQRNEAARRQVGIGARANVTECPTEYPIQAIIVNNGRKTVSYVSYGIAIVDPASGADVAPTHLSYLSTTQDLPPNMVLRICHTPYRQYGAPTGFTLRPDHRIRATVNHVSIR